MLAEAADGQERAAPAEARRGATAVLHLSYLPAPGEAGAEDMARALELLGAPAPPPGFTLHRVRR